MGTSKFWWYPAPGQTSEETDLGETVSDLQFNPLPNQSITEGLTGALAQTQFNSRGVVRIVHERFTSGALARDLYALETHLKNGGLVSFAVDADKAFAGFLIDVPDRGDSSFTVDSQFFPFNASASLASGDEVEIMGAQPYAVREFLAVTSQTGNAVVTSETTRFSLVEGASRWALLRDRGFWPLLRLSKDQRSQPLLTHDHRISYTFDAQLEEAIDILDLLATVPDASVNTSTPNEAGFDYETVNQTSRNIVTTQTGGTGGTSGGTIIPGGLPGLSELMGF